MSTIRQKILVYGITGMTGSRISQLLSDKFKIVGPPHSHLDITNKKKVQLNLRDILPDQIIYVAGMTKVDEAQQNKKLAFLLNAEVPGYIAQIAASLRIPMHYISTDAVFDGTQKKRPYIEVDKTNPLSIYGKSKLKGEKNVLSASYENSVIRTIMIYTADFPHRKDFARFAYESLKNKNQFAAITDQIINPTFVDDLVNAISHILEKRANGIYHVAATDYLSNYEFVKKIAKKFNMETKLINKISFYDFFKNKPAPRTQYCWLDTSKFQKDFGKNILKKTDESLSVFKRQIRSLDEQPIDL